MYFSVYHNKIYGATISNYLLEKSRVCKVASQERGYHVFYFLLGCEDPTLLGKLHLLKPNGQPYTWQDFRYLKSGSTRPGENAKREF